MIHLLAARHLVVHRHRFTLDVYRRRALSRTWYHEERFHIAVGMAGLETPEGMYEVQNRSRRPSYQYPSSSWVPDSLKGVLLKFGDPRNPIAKRWMGLGADGVGIHGTFDEDSIGTAASHGCIRMAGKDVVKLYGVTRKGTTVYIY